MPRQSQHDLDHIISTDQHGVKVMNKKMAERISKIKISESILRTYSPAIQSSDRKARSRNGSTKRGSGQIRSHETKKFSDIRSNSTHNIGGKRRNIRIIDTEVYKA